MPWLLIYLVVGWLIRAGMIPVVLRRQFAPGASVAWLGIVFLHPYIGLALYLAVGESRLGPRRAEQHRQIVARLRDPARHTGRQSNAVQPEHCPSYQSMVLQAEKISGLPVLGGNAIDFLPDARGMVDRLVADIDSATEYVHLLYYIFYSDTTGRRVADALQQAAKRGVKCRVLADAVASRAFFSRRGIGRVLASHGIEVAAALPVAPLRRRLARLDLRNHRKLAIIDGRVGFAGSHNLINADYGGRRGGPWFDLTARFTGPVVSELAGVFIEDWAFETGKELALPPDQPMVEGSDDVIAQVVPTGPSAADTTYRRVLLAAIQCSRSQLTLTTPYFVPDETTVVSLKMAADRGVDVKLILPARADHFFTAAAGRAHFQALLGAGVSIYLYKPGLIHAKTTTVDDAFAVFGSANLDVRSFSLNFELSVLLYGSEVTNRLRAIQEGYLSQSAKLDIAIWSKRPPVFEYADQAITLLSPLL